MNKSESYKLFYSAKLQVPLHKKLEQTAAKIKIDQKQRQIFLNSNSFLFIPEQVESALNDSFHTFTQLKKNQFDQYFAFAKP